MNEQDRVRQIADRRAQMPRAYRATYDKAVKGKSLRAAINSFCLECVCHQIEDVRPCADIACPLWAVRPYQEGSQKGHHGHSAPPESTKSSHATGGGRDASSARAGRNATLTEENRK